MEYGRNPYLPRRTPEHPPQGVEGEHNRVNSLIGGVLELASLEPTRPVDFIRMAFKEMDKAGIEPDDYNVSLIMEHGFGSREAVTERISGLTPDEFDKSYPDQIGDLVRWYVQPPTEPE